MSRRRKGISAPGSAGGLTRLQSFELDNFEQACSVTYESAGWTEGCTVQVWQTTETGSPALAGTLTTSTAEAESVGSIGYPSEWWLELRSPNGELLQRTARTALSP